MSCFKYFVAILATICPLSLAMPLATPTRVAEPSAVNSSLPAASTPFVNVPVPLPDADRLLETPVLNPGPVLTNIPAADRQHDKNSRQLVPGQPIIPDEELLGAGEKMPFITPGIVIPETGEVVPVMSSGLEEESAVGLGTVQPPANFTRTRRNDDEVKSTFKDYLSGCSACNIFNGAGQPANNGHKLGCMCESGKGMIWPKIRHSFSSINLNQRLGNADGNLVWNSVRYQASCRNMFLRDGHYYHAECADKQGHWKETSIDFNNYIGLYDDGNELTLQVE